MYDKLNYLNYKDSKLRQTIRGKELIVLLLKNCVLDIRLYYKYRFFLTNFFLNKTKAQFTKIRSRCFYTGRSRFVFKYFNLNRNSLKYFSSFGYISGFRKY